MNIGTHDDVAQRYGCTGFSATRLYLCRDNLSLKQVHTTSAWGKSSAFGIAKYLKVPRQLDHNHAKTIRDANRFKLSIVKQQIV